jgi:hypothetical protein
MMMRGATMGLGSGIQWVMTAAGQSFSKYRLMSPLEKSIKQSSLPRGTAFTEVHLVSIAMQDKNNY